MEELSEHGPPGAGLGILGSMVVVEQMRSRRKNPLVTGLLVVPVVPLALLAALRLLGFDGGWYTLVALALTPFAAAAGALAGGLALALRRWWIGGVALVLALALAVVVLPRASAGEQRAVQGKTLRVLASNLLYGRADPKAVVDLVREQRIDVLNLVEMTPSAVDGLTAAGLFDLLPYRVLHPAPGAFGSGIAARLPLKEVNLTGDSAAKQPGAEVDLGDGVVAEIVAVHPISPDVDTPQWEHEIKDLSQAAGEHGLRILAGDFNATLDHAAYRTVLARGYRDAAEERGEGLDPTWPSSLPVVTIDHVAVDNRAAVLDYRVFDVAGSDHRAVFAEVRLP
ncbi:endonuclease/exonuclease/phosphatase [Amycolatopsis mediterranei S699]|uniref:Endonuclease/exonuclease/phosphatase n=2 Tax=Amycolatopsis mediterranei TaxID=33910 RepID=A0A0H3DJS4_AMYMU|nr:endonuclease/exonuclease/phosphatase family protein [Amycolatopsis mediterranei]ADJ50413.1 endonuclease/exonuclease/phosphatase [Amycolatopsis mediterranei U32]AEK47414.1 endonuclease/exonuclease/phosphatase [Amycolatopsis mediterranei S699]AFO82119.1 endonuclease/exonuclease/phosphatase [Amycolatopsis mediterranei S699]AGT89248.1 endonuclease/exonuclease/phosphatase [Amycolatopsis mediterranei RB]KDO08201.1 endonuclease [Amycolatopsis mediterranei]